MGFHYRAMGFHYMAIFGKIWKVVFSRKIEKILEFFSKLHVQKSIIEQPKSTNFLEEF
jgi:hypothetical protein